MFCSTSRPDPKAEARTHVARGSQPGPRIGRRGRGTCAGRDGRRCADRRRAAMAPPGVGLAIGGGFYPLASVLLAAILTVQFPLRWAEDQLGRRIRSLPPPSSPWL